MDIQYNVGNIKQKFPKFLEAVREKNIEKMIKESHRKGILEKRNNWAKRLMQQVKY